MNRSTSKNSLQDLMDPWFAGEKPMAGVTLRPRATSAASSYQAVNLQADPEADTDDRRDHQDSGEQLSDYYSGRNMELRDYAQFTGNYRFAQGSGETTMRGHMRTDSSGSGGSAGIAAGFTWQQQQQQRPPMPEDDRSFTAPSSIIGLADSEGNGFDYASWKEDGSSQRARSVDGQSLQSQEAYPAYSSSYVEAHSESAEAKGHVSAGEMTPRSPLEFPEGEIVMQQRRRATGKDALRDISVSHEDLEQSLRTHITSRESSVIYTGGIMDSLERICTSEELWDCASHWPCDKDKIFKAIERRLFDIDLMDSSGRTALMNACIKEKEAVVWFLLSHGARVDVQNEHGYTALMWCCIYGRKVGVQLLLEAGASQDLCRRDGKTAWDIASNFITGYPVIVKILDEYKKRKLETRR